MPTLTLRRTAAAAAVAALAASVAIAQPASAGDITVTATVTADASTDALYVTHETATANLGSTPFDPGTTGSATLSANLHATTVTDTRGTPLAPWVVTVGAADLTHGNTETSATIDDVNGRVYLNVIDADALTGTLTGMTVAGGEFEAGISDLGTDYTLINGTTTLGNGSVTYTPRMDLTVPSGTPAGTYTTTVTQTVS